MEFKWWVVSCLLTTAVLVSLPLVFYYYYSPSMKDSHSTIDGCDCRYQCEWQVIQMNKTFNILINACEEKVQKLHKSDMNMAIIREQLNKEMLELFLYMYQTMSRRFQNIKEESIPQFCSDYCITLGISKCKKGVTMLQLENQRLLDRQRKLKLQLQSQRELQQPGNVCVSQHKLIIGTAAVILLVIPGTIALTMLLCTCNKARQRRRISPTAPSRLRST